MQIGKAGDYVVAHFFDNVGGLNTADSPFKVDDSQATGGRNFEYTLTGGFRKIKGATQVNSVADSALKSLGLGLLKTTANVKTVIRAADRKLQSVDLSIPSFTNLTEDTLAASSTFLALNSTQVVSRNQYSTTSADMLWMGGGGMSSLYAAYSAAKVTKNGVTPPAGAITATRAAGAGGAFLSTGTYFYGVAYRKTSTQALSNVALDVSSTVTVVTDKITIDLTGLTGLDTTRHDKIYIYRSAVGGVTAFTTGDLIAQVASTDTSYIDLGSYISTAQNVPRAGNTVLDNSELPSGTYNVVATYKRRLVTASGSTIYLSDLNKPESFPTGNYFVIPSGGPITGLAVISYTTPNTSGIDELLVIFKEQEMWVITGSSITDWALKFIDTVGCPNQPLIVAANGHIAWIDYRGIWMWSGAGKPTYVSRLIGDLFKEDGNIDKSKLNLGWGEFFRNRDQIIWTVSTNTEGEQLFRIKMDTRLTLPQVQSNVGGSQTDAVLITDVLTTAHYAGCAMLISNEEILLAGDSAGHLHKLFTSYADASSAIDFQYETRHLDMGTPGMTKRYVKVIAWCEDSSDANLTLQYWTTYTSGLDESGSVSSPQSSQVQEALWDFAYWDAAYWDSTTRGFNPVVFNLDSQAVSTEGDALKLRFKQQDANAPVTIAGFSIIFAEVASRK